MEGNVNYLGYVNLLRVLIGAGHLNKTEANKIAARLAVDSGADIIIKL